MHDEIITREAADEDGTKIFVLDIVHMFQLHDTVLLYGELGSGKTFLVREFVKAFGVTGEVSSPSFALVNQYLGEPIINHIDLYRISNRKDLENLGLEDYWDMNAINFVEWPQIIEQQIIWPHFRLHIDTDLKKRTWRRFRLEKYFG
jgi:tRNA threonylcarbamoyl adenosine modification protein YjeE